MKKVSFLGKRIVVFTAHPDDEGLSAGTMYENYKAGGETFLICATAGEKGKSHLAKPVSDAALKKIRRNELLKAAKILHINKVIFFGFPDASVRARKKQLYEKALPVIKKIKPDHILSFGPDGISAHWDHITVGQVALKIAKKLKIPLAAFTLSDMMILLRSRRKKFFTARRKFGDYAGIPEHRKGNITVKIDVAMKRKAMRSHVSQFGANSSGSPFSQLPKRIAEKAFRNEHFVQEKI
jgi:LmbE family N-acetylglucosaminyl deacetylase